MAATATTLAVLFSLVVYGLFWVAAPAFATLAGSVEATPIVRLLTTVILIDGVTAVRVGSLQRSFRQHRTTMAHLAGLVIQAAVAISLAIKGAGAFSFAAGQVAGALVIGAIVLWSAGLPWRFGFDRAIARRLTRFGLPLAMALGVEAVLRNVDYIVVGQALGTVALGYYLLAFRASPRSVEASPMRRAWPRAATKDENLASSSARFSSVQVSPSMRLTRGLSRHHGVLLRARVSASLIR